ncbi:MAG: hypothetical protein R2813_12605 [Flavobacteriales bacterium]
MSDAFETIARDLMEGYVITSFAGTFEFMELEFYLTTHDQTHHDPFTSCSKPQKKFGHWFLNKSGVDLTFGSPGYCASIMIRSVQDIETGQLYMGPWRVFELLFEDAGSAEKNELRTRIVPRTKSQKKGIISVPRVYPPVERDSKDIDARINFAFRPYRYVRTDIADYPEKYVAYLYLDKFLGKRPDIKEDSKIYHKYVQFFDRGVLAESLEQIWNVSSRMHRMAMLMGYVYNQKKESTAIVSGRDAIN